jgi:NifU-like protein involved in Fe-S cluster formation
MRKIATMLLPLILAGCGADVASTAATEAELKAQEVKQAEKTKEQVLQKLDAASQAEQKRLEDADKQADQ